METRSRKRAEGSSIAQSCSSSSSGPVTRSSKRSCLSGSSSSSGPITRSSSSKRVGLAVSSSSSSISTAGATVVPTSSVLTRSRSSRTLKPFVSSAARPMDLPNESNGSRRDRDRDRRKNLDEKNSDKGKVKAYQGMGSDRGVERSLGLNLDGGRGGEDNDNDSKGGVGKMPKNLSSSGSALRGLIRKFGAGLDDMLPSGKGSASSSRHTEQLQMILSGLRAAGKEGKQVEALTQLCDVLCIGTEDSLNTFSVDAFTSELVMLVNYESNPDIMLLAARALNYMCDALPPSCAVVVDHGGVECLCARLLTIEYMDLAEQSLQALQKISQEQPTDCLRAGALMAVLSYLDFFSTGVQRVALSTAVNLCKHLPLDAAEFVMEAVPLLTNLLHYHDSQVLEHASVCLTQIAEAFASCPDKLDELCNHGVVTQATSLISTTSNAGGGLASLSTPTYTGIIRLLSTCASGSNLGAKALLLLGISKILKDILSDSDVSANASVSPALSRPSEQIFEIVNLANEILPPLPQGTISLLADSSLFVKGSFVKKSPVSCSGKQKKTNENAPEVSVREKLLNDQPEILEQFGMDLLPVLIQIYGSSVSGPVHHRCLSVIGKSMYLSTAEMIQSLLSVTNLPRFLAGVLAWKDPHVLIPALQITEILMEKLPGTFFKMFVREGVVHAVDQLIITGNPNVVNAQALSAEKDDDSLGRTPLHSRRYRQQTGNSNLDGNSLLESRNAMSVNIGSTPSSVGIPTLSSNLRLSVSACAKALKVKYFPSNDGADEVGLTDDVLHLKHLCMKLNAGVDEQNTKSKGKSKVSVSLYADNSANKEEYLVGLISAMLGELNKGEGVSTFEFIGTGVVAALLNYFSCGHFSKERIPKANLPKICQLAVRRFKSFVAVALPSAIARGSVAPMTILVQRLQDALSSLERFPVMLSHSSRSSCGSSHLSSGLSALSQPIKLLLCRAEGEKCLRDYSSHVLLINPLTTLAAVEGFLWPRVQQGKSVGNSKSGTTPAGGGASFPSDSTQPSKTGHHSTRSGLFVNIEDDVARKEPSQYKTSSSSKGKGKAVLKPSQEEARGAQTRTTDRRRAALDRDAQMKPVNGDSSSEDAELDISPVVFDDALMIEDCDISDDEIYEDDDYEDLLGDDFLPTCEFNKVHDVKLGGVGSVAAATIDSQTHPISGFSSMSATGRGLNSADFRSGNSDGSKNAASFSAASMGRLQSSNGRGIRRGRDQQGHTLFGSDFVSSDGSRLEGSSDPPKLMFTVGGKQLDRQLTIYQAIQHQLVLDEDDDERYAGSDFVSSDGSRLWSDIYTIKYQRVDNQAGKASVRGSCSGNPSKCTKSGSASNSSSDTLLPRMPLLESILQGGLIFDLEKSNPTYDILALLCVLEGLNQLAPHLGAQLVSENSADGKILSLAELSASGARISAEEFINRKLTPKLTRQIQDSLALCSGSLPSWCYQLTKACPFLFPFDTRRLYFYSTAFGLSRALYRLQQLQGADGHGSANGREVRFGRLQRHKVRVARKRILDSAAIVMKMCPSQKAVLEVEYFGEVGTGLGPTLEFYTLLSHDIQKIELGMWRSQSSSERSSMKRDGNKQKYGKITDLRLDSTAGDSNLVEAPLGLFPRPWPPNADASDGKQFSKVIEYFRLVGCVMAKALQDGRLLDLTMSAAFYKLVLGQELDLHDILSFDAEFGKILQELHVVVSQRNRLESIGGDNSDAIADLRFCGARIEDLCLDFTLPGYPDYILKPGDEIVDINNLEVYMSLVVDATIKTGIMRQVEAFRAGFNQVFDISILLIFTPTELDYLLCGRRELWEADTLADHIKFDHGYTVKSPAIVNLLEILREFTPEQQRAFCQFVTGAPRLPPGGLAVLNPKLTVVRKHSSAIGHAASNGTVHSEFSDNDLPSVMTCANYLKLPPYSTKEIMFNKLIYAINEGQGSFDLS